MSTRNSWTYTEIERLIENYDTPIQELVKMFPRHSQSSVNRKILRLRKEGRVGDKSPETIKEAYRLRHNKDDK